MSALPPSPSSTAHLLWWDVSITCGVGTAKHTYSCTLMCADAMEARSRGLAFARSQHADLGAMTIAVSATGRAAYDAPKDEKVAEVRPNEAAVMSAFEFVTIEVNPTLYVQEEVAA